MTDTYALPAFTVPAGSVSSLTVPVGPAPLFCAIIVAQSVPVARSTGIAYGVSCAPAAIATFCGVTGIVPPPPKGRPFGALVVSGRGGRAKVGPEAALGSPAPMQKRTEPWMVG